jgi:hypothetical protein
MLSLRKAIHVLITTRGYILTKKSMAINLEYYDLLGYRAIIKR